MQKLYNTLKTALWSFIGVFLGAALFRCGDRRAHPGLYVSAPWYAELLSLGALTAGAVLLLLLAMYLAKRRIRRGQEDSRHV